MFIKLIIKKLHKTITEKFGGDWIIGVRLHPNVAKYSDKLIPKGEYIYDLTKYPDIQELLSVTDILISDYSSCVYDYILSRKPVFLYATDVEKYEKYRGLYYPLSSTPFPVAKNNKELSDNILNFDNTLYKQKVEEFLNGKGCIEDGNAANRTVDLITQLIEK